MNGKIILTGVFVACVVVSIVLGYAVREAAGPIFPKAPKTVVIVDEMARPVEVPCPPDRIVALGSYSAEVIYALGEENRIVGRSQYCLFPPPIENKPNLGTYATLNPEAVLGLKPDLVIANTWLELTTKDQIEKGVPVVIFNAWRMETLRSMISSLGLMLDKQNRAEELLEFINSYTDLIEERTENVKTENKPRVFYESFRPYKTISAGTDTHELLTLAGGVNVFAGEPVPYPTVNAEAVVVKDPEIIVHGVASSEIGYKPAPTLEDMAGIREEILTRHGLEPTDAVKNRNVFALYIKLTAGVRRVVGLAYLARWLHPDLFADLNPAAIHENLQDNFFNLTVEGVFAYPE